MSINGISLQLLCDFAKNEGLKDIDSQRIRYELEVPSDGLVLAFWSSPKTNSSSPHRSQDLYVPCAVYDVSFKVGCGIFGKKFTPYL